MGSTPRRLSGVVEHFNERSPAGSVGSVVICVFLQSNIISLGSRSGSDVIFSPDTRSTPYQILERFHSIALILFNSSSVSGPCAIFALIVTTRFKFGCAQFFNFGYHEILTNSLGLIQHFQADGISIETRTSESGKCAFTSLYTVSAWS